MAFNINFKNERKWIKAAIERHKSRPFSHQKVRAIRLLERELAINGMNNQSIPRDKHSTARQYPSFRKFTYRARRAGYFYSPRYRRYMKR